MKLLLDLIKLNLILWILSVSEVHGQKTSFSNFSTQEITLKEYAEKKIEDLKLQLHLKLDEMRLLTRRSISEKEEDSFFKVMNITSEKLNFMLYSLQPVSAWCPVYENKSYVLFATAKNSVIILKNFEFKPLFQLPSYQSFYSIQDFHYDNRIWLIGLYKNVLNKHFMQIFEYDSFLLKERQRLALRGRSAVSVVKRGSKIYLSSISVAKSKSVFKLFEWSHSQFDMIISKSFAGSYGALMMWNIHSAIYIAVSLEDHRRTLIMAFDAYGEKLKKIQYLEETAHIIKYFKDGDGSYIVCVVQNRIIIYWWSGSNFLKQQEISSLSKHIVDISVINLYSIGTVLAIAWNDQVSYFVQDVSSHYVSIGSTYFSPGSLKSIILWKMNSSLYLLPLLNDSSLIEVYRLKASFNVLYLERKMENLKDCTTNFAQLLNERNTEIRNVASKVAKVWSPKGTFSMQNLIINGFITASDNVRTYKVHISNNVTIESPSHVQNLLFDQESKIRNLQTTLDEIVLKSLPEELKTSIHFMKPVFIRDGNISKIKEHVYLNGVVTSLLQSALKINGHQIFSYAMFEAIKASNVATILLNNKEMTEYFHLRKSNRVIGSFVFKDISLQNMQVSKGNTVNQMDLQNIVLSSQLQNIKGPKYFARLSVNILWCKNVNGKTLSETALLYLDAANITKLLNFTSELIVHSDIEAFSIGSINISHLARASTKKIGHEMILGLKNFKAPVRIEDKLDVSGLINKYNISHLMTLSIPQIIFGHVHFSNIAFKELYIHVLNEFDFEKEIVRKSDEKNIIKNKIYFSKDVKVENIKMADDVLIDSVDPSYVLSKILKIVSNSSIKMRNVTVLDKMETKKSEFFLLDYLRHVWMKTKPQNISYFAINECVLKEIKVLLLNNLHINEFVLVNGRSHINSSKTFQDDTEIGTFELRSEKDLALSLDILNSNAQLKILNTINLENMLVKGNLKLLSDLNNINSSQLMHTQANQICFSMKTFSAIEVYDLSLGNLRSQMVKNIDLSKFLINCVMASPESPVFNKTFRYLSGNLMTAKGHVNGKSILEFIHTAVTLDKSQIVLGNIDFDGPVVTKKINVSTFFSNIKLSSVVLLDKKQSIVSPKIFRGIFTTTAMETTGKFNGINLDDLKSNAFSKVHDNFVVKFFKFGSNFQAQEIHANAAMDGIHLGNTIILGRNMTLKNINLKTMKTKSISSESINGCNFTFIYENAILLKQNKQLIRKKISFKRLKVDGRLKIVHLNGNFIDDFIKSVFHIHSHDNLSGHFCITNITVHNLFLKDFINNVNTNFIISDAVRKKEYQVIEAQKTFQDLVTNNISMNTLETKSVSGVDMKRLYKICVKKRFKKNIKIMLKEIPHVFAKNITITGSLNGIDVPLDLVLVNTNDHLYHVIINNTMNITSGLFVLGEVDKINLKTLVNSRVTLQEFELVSSMLEFVTDISVKDHLEVQGFVNQIKFAEVVTKIKLHNISGIKTFNDSLYLALNLSAASVNEVPTKIFAAIKKTSQNESLSNTAEFHQINTSDLMAFTINNISLTKLWDLMHKVHDNVYAYLDEFALNINNSSYSLGIQHLATDYLLSAYAFFELHQVLNIGKVQRFLPVYEHGRHGDEFHATQMILWVKKNHTCWNVKSSVVEVLPNGSLSSMKRLKGKIYPFFVRRHQGLQGFYLQTQPSNRCTMTKSFIKTLYMNEAIDFNTSVSQSHLLSSNSSILDAKLFETRRGIYMIILFNVADSQEKIYIYQYSTDNKSWKFHQKFHNSTAGSLAIIAKKNIYLAVTSDSEPAVYTYEFIHKEKNFQLITESLTSASRAALWVKNNDNLYLLLAKEKFRLQKDEGWPETFTDTLEVYILEEKLILDHSVNIQGIRALEKINIAGETYVLASSQHMQIIYVIQYRGYNGFEVIQEIPAPGIVETTIFKSKTNDLMLAISSSTGHTRILKAIFRGGKYFDY